MSEESENAAREPFKYWDDNESSEIAGLSDEMLNGAADMTSKRDTISFSRTISAFLMSYDEYPGGRIKFKCIRGPIGDGKSVGCCMYIVKKSQEQIPIEVTEKGRTFKVKWSRWLIMRHTLKSIKETTLTTWNQWFGDKTRWKTEPFEGRYEDVLADGTVLRIDFIVLASESKNILSDLQSLELSGAWINEAVFSPYEVVSKVYTRLKRFNPNPKSKVQLKTFHVVMDTNSPPETNWWRRKEEVDQPDGWLFFVCPPAILEEIDPVTKQSRFVPNDVEHAKKHGRRPAENVFEIDGGYHHGMSYWTDMLSVLDRDDIRKLLQNQFGLSVGGLGVYREVWNPATMVIPDAEAEFMKGLPVVGGMDFGRTPCCLLGQVRPDGKLVTQVEVTTWDPKLNGEDNGGLVRMDVIKFYEEYLLPALVTYYGYPNCRLTIFGDPAGNNMSDAFSVSAIQRLRQRGVNVIACNEVESSVQGEFDITHGNSPDIRISTVKQQMRSGMLLIAHRCTMLREAMAGKYFFETIRSVAANGTGIRSKDTPCKNDWSHISDAYQYKVLAVYRGAINYGNPMNSYAANERRYVGLTDLAGSIDAACL